MDKSNARRKTPLSIIDIHNIKERHIVPCLASKVATDAQADLLAA